MPIVFRINTALAIFGASILVALPILSLWIRLSFEAREVFYMVSFVSVFLVMMIRPLADIFSGQLWLRKLVILRKGFGILSASIIVGFIISSLLSPQSPYRTAMLTPEFWSLQSFAFFAHIGDITGILLLVTSNRFAQKILGKNWKRVQRLSYPYFYSGAIYHSFALRDDFALYAMLAVTNVTVLAWAIKAWKRVDVL